MGEFLLLTMVEAASELRVSRSQIYRLVTRGELPTVRLGGSRRVTRAALEHFVSRLQAEEPIAHQPSSSVETSA